MFEQEHTEATERRVSILSVCSVLSFLVGAWENQPRNALSQFKSTGIDDQSQRDIKEFHVAE